MIHAVILIILGIAALIFSFDRKPSVSDSKGIQPSIVKDSEDKNASPEYERAEGWVVGTITSPSKQAIKNSQVCAYGENPVEQTIKKCQRPNTDGLFEMPLAVGTYRLLVSAENYRSETHSITITKDLITAAEFFLEPSNHNIRGNVISASGDPLENVEISIVKNGSIVSETLTDPAGKFQTWSPEGAIIITARAKEYAQGEIFSSAPSHDLLIKLFPGMSISGKVLDKATEKPIKAVKVIANQENRLITERSVFAVTDDEGNFTLNGLTLGTSFLRVFDKEWTQNDSILIDSNKSPNNPIVIYAEKGQPFSGQLITDKGNCESGQLSLRPTDSSNSPSENPIDLTIFNLTNGQANFPALPINEYYSVAHCNEYELAQGPDRVNLKNDHSAQWQFNSGLTLNVLVENESGGKVQYASLILKQQSTSDLNSSSSDSLPHQDTQENIFSSKNATTDESGFYKFGGLTAGLYTLEAFPPGLNAIDPVIKSVNISEATNDLPIKLILKGQGSIEIESYSSDGSPNSRTLFYAIDESNKRFEAIYSGSGKFLISPLPLGRYQVFAYDNKNPKVSLTKNESEWITLDPYESVNLIHENKNYAGKIDGLIYNHAGELESGVQVRAISEHLNDEDAYYSVIQDIMHGNQNIITKNGKFSFDNLVPETAYHLLIATMEGVEIKKSSVYPGDPVEIFLPAPKTLSGRVLLPTGEPAQDFSITIFTPNSHAVFQEFKTNNGEFSIETFGIDDPFILRITDNQKDFFYEQETTFNNNKSFKLTQHKINESRE